MNVQKLEVLKRNPEQIFTNMNYVVELNALIMESIRPGNKVERPLKRALDQLGQKLLTRFTQYFTPENVYRACCLESFGDISDPECFGERCGLYFLMTKYAHESDFAAEEYFRAIVLSLGAAPKILNVDERDPHTFYAAHVQANLAAKFEEDADGRIHPECKALCGLFRRAQHSDEALKLLHDVMVLANTSFGDKELLISDLTDGVAQRLCDESDPLWEFPGYGADVAMDERLEARLPQLIALADLLYEEICTSARADIRPKGTDSFVVKSPSGMTAEETYFLREGTTFPQVTVVAERKLSSGSRWYSEGLLLAPELSELLDFEQNGDPGKGASRPGWLMYTALAELIAYHHFTCRAPREGSNGVGSGSSASRDASVKLVPIRPFLRRLPEGARPSEEAVAQARAVFNRDLPEGFTFVRKHDGLRGWSTGQASADPTTSECSGERILIDMKDVLSWIE